MGQGSDEKELERARNSALRLLSYRARSVCEMRDKLSEKKFSEAVIDDTIERLTRALLLDDADFAHQLAASLFRRKHGPKSVLARLRSKGIETDMAESALKESLRDAGGEKALAHSLLLKRYGDIATKDSATRRKAAGYLTRKGFSHSVAASVCFVYSDIES